MLLTSNILANITAEAHRLDSNQKARAFRTYRNIVSKGVVPYTIDPEDGRESKLFKVDAAGVIVLLTPLASMGVETVFLRKISARLFEPELLTPGAPVGVPYTPIRMIDRLFAAVRAGKKADLVVTLEREGVEPPKIVTRVEIEGDEKPEKVARILAAYREMAVEVLAEMRVNANGQLTPLIEIEG